MMTAQLFLSPADMNAGDKLLWSEKLNPFEAPAKKSPFLPVGVLLLVLISGKVLQLYSRSDAIGAVVSIIFIGVLLWMISFPFSPFWAPKATNYIITYHRLLIIRRRGKKMKSIKLEAVRQLERIRK